MTTKINDGGPMYPLPVRTDGNAACWNQHGGLSVRQWYAGQALAGMISNHDLGGTHSEYATDAFKYADAMLAHEAKELEA